VRDPEDDRQPQDRLELVGVAEGRETPVQQVCLGAGPRRRHPVHVTEGHQDQADQEPAAGERRPPVTGQREPEETGQDDDEPEQDDVAGREHHPPRRPHAVLLATDRRDPLGRAAKGLGDTGDGRRHPPVLDPVQERRAVPAQEDQRADPPRRGEHHGQ
jgi:hypothetical protein